MNALGPAVDVSRYAPRFGVRVDDRALSAEATHMVRSVEVVQELDKASAFNIELQDEMEEGRFRWLDRGGLFDFGNHVVVTLGYADQLETMCDGLVQRIAASFSEGLAPGLTVGGFDTAYDVLAEPRGSETFRDLRDSEIVERVARAAGLKAEAVRTPVIHPVKTKPSGQSYMQLLRALAADNGFSFAFSGRRLTFGPEAAGGKPAMTFAWGRDLLSFQPQIDTSTLVSEVVVRAWDAVAGQLIEERATAGSEGAAEGGERPGSEVVRDSKHGATRVISDRPVRSPLEARQLAQSELARSSNRLVSGSGEVQGTVALRPAMHVRLAGLGSWFDGTYYVTKVTHTVSDQGFRSRFDAQRSSL